MKARVYVTLKPGVLDPAGQATASGLRALGHAGIRGVRIGRFFDIELDDSADPSDPADPTARISKMCDELLANPVMEDYTVEILP